MPLITWNAEQYGTNVAFADNEHKRLFDLLNTLYDLALSGAERADIGKALDVLITYVVEHFAHEEREMEEKLYPGLVAHKVEHDKLLAICGGLQKQFHAGVGEVTAATGALVKGWLDSHIPAFDMPYADTLNS